MALHGTVGRGEGGRVNVRMRFISFDEWSANGLVAAVGELSSLTSRVVLRSFVQGGWQVAGAWNRSGKSTNTQVSTRLEGLVSRTAWMNSRSREACV